LRVTANGQSATQPLEVIKDPTITSSDADLVASTQMQIRIRDDIEQTSTSINAIEVMRKTLEDAQKAHPDNKELLKSLRDMDQKLQSVEFRFIERAAMASDDKYFQPAYKGYSNLIWLKGAGGTGASDEGGGADFRPSDTQVAVLAAIEKALNAAKSDYSRVMETDVEQF